MKNLGIKKCVFLFNREVVSSSNLHPMDLYVLNEYLNDSLFPKFTQRRNIQSFDDRDGCFIFEQDSDTIHTAPRVYLRNNNDVKAYRMVTFCQLDVTLVMFVDGEKNGRLDHQETILNVPCFRQSRCSE